MATTEGLNRLGHRSRRLRSATDASSGYWQDAAGRRIRTRYLDPLGGHSEQLLDALHREAQAAETARDVADLMARQCDMCRTHLDAAAEHQTSAVERVKVAVQYLDQAGVALGAGSQSLERALQLAASAGGACGGGTSVGALDDRITNGLYREVRAENVKTFATRAALVIGARLISEGVNADGLDDLIVEGIDAVREPGHIAFARGELAAAMAKVRSLVGG